MPVVPTYEDRGIRLDPGLNFRDTTKATKEMFGSDIGTALGTAGKGLTDIGQAVSDAAVAREKAKADAAKAGKPELDLAHVENEAAANAGTQRLVAGLAQSRDNGGDAPNSGSQTETGPVDTFLQHQADMDGVVKGVRDSLSPDAQAIFDGKVAPILFDAKKQALEAQAEARKSAIQGGYMAGADAYRDHAIAVSTDETSYQTSLAMGLKEIEKLGFLQRWEPEHLDQVTAAYISEARKRSTLKIAETNPLAALKYSLDHESDLSSADKMALHDAMKPGLDAAVKRVAAHTSQANPAPDQFAATDLPPAAYVLLGAIGQTEASSYDARSGGGRFDDFATFPDEIGIGGASKVGRYGLDGSTWVRVAGQAGLADFSPASQDRGAWALAQKNYRTQTGRSLEDDINAGRWDDIRKELAPTWAGLAKLTDEDFVKFVGVRAAIAGGAQKAPGNVGSDVTATTNAGVAPSIGAPVLTPTVQLPPEVEAVLGRLPQAQADDLRKAALAGVLEGGQGQAKADMVQQATRAEAYRQRIDSGDRTLTPREIDEDVVLKTDQKAELKGKWEAKNQERLETERNVQKLARGELKFDNYGQKTQASVDRLWADILTRAKTPGEALPQLSEVVRQAGMVPLRAINDIQQALASRDPAKVAVALQTSQRLMTDSEEAVRRSDRRHVVENAATDFGVAVANVGPDAAVARYIEKSDPARRPVVDDATMNRMLSRITLQDVGDLFEDSTGHPYMGFMLANRDQILADYRDDFREAFLETGDPEIAKARAGEAFKRVYGVTYVTGHPTLMKYPAERYHGEVGGSRDWQAKQFSRLVEDVRASMKDPTIQPGNVMLEPAEGTAEAVAAGKAPLYRVFVMRKGADGKIVRQEIGDGLLFGFDEAGARAENARADVAEELELRKTLLENARKRGQGHKDDQDRLEKVRGENARILDSFNKPGEYLPVTGEHGGQGSFDPDAGETRVYAAADVSDSDATLSLWLRKERERKASVDAEQRKAIGEEARKGNYHYVPPDDSRHSRDKAEREFTPEEIRQEKERIAAEWNAHRPIGLRGMLDRGAREIDNDGQLITNLKATQEALETRSRENAPAPKLWVTSYDQAETIKKETQTIEEPVAVDTSYTRTALAALRQNSVIVSLITNQTWASDDGTTDPTLDVIDELRGTKYEAYTNRALNIFNRPALEAWKAQIDMEMEDKRTLEAAGMTGQVFSLVASLVSPETLIPGGAVAKGLVKGIIGASKVVPPAALVKAFENLAGEISGAAFQAILQESQITSDPVDSQDAYITRPMRSVFIDHLSDKAKERLMKIPELKRAVELFGDFLTDLVKEAVL